MTEGGGAPTPSEVLIRLHGEMTRAGVVSMLVQIWAEAPRDPELAEIARHKIAEVRRLLQEALHPWAATQPGDADRHAADAADTVMLLFQGITVRGSIQPDADREALLRAVTALLP
jgi:hypothetical protein